MTLKCPHCLAEPFHTSGSRNIIRHGHFHRTSDGRDIQKFRCKVCRKMFSHATADSRYRQNKRHLNHPLKRFLISTMSQRDCALNLNINRKTVVRKLIFLAAEARKELVEQIAEWAPSQLLQFDELETFEHTKCKPLSVAVAVEEGSRRVLGFAISRMPPKGKHQKIRALKKYGPRKDERRKGRLLLLKHLAPLVADGAIIKTDRHPHYPGEIRTQLPTARHQTFEGQRATVAGQREMKQKGFDPLFSINHTFALFRARLSRLIRDTWCTTKRQSRLEDHLVLFIAEHNKKMKALEEKRWKLASA